MSLTSTTPVKPFIDFGNDAPGIVAIINYDKSLGTVINNLADTLLRRESTLSISEREWLASEVSAANNTEFCANSHWAFCKAANGGQEPAISPKMAALREIAVFTATGEMGSHMNPYLIESAISLKATPMEVHEAIAIASAFCFFNRLVMFENTPLPPAEFYPACAERINEVGYLESSSI